MNGPQQLPPDWFLPRVAPQRTPNVKEPRQPRTRKEPRPRIPPVHRDPSTQILKSIRIDPAVMAKLRARATVRGLSQGEYISRLIDLHDTCRSRGSSEIITRILESLGLQTIREGE